MPRRARVCLTQRNAKARRHRIRNAERMRRFREERQRRNILHGASMASEYERHLSESIIEQLQNNGNVTVVAPSLIPKEKGPKFVIPKMPVLNSNFNPQNKLQQSFSVLSTLLKYSNKASQENQIDDLDLELLTDSATKFKQQGWYEQAQKDILKLDSNILSVPERIHCCCESSFHLNGDITKVVAQINDQKTSDQDNKEQIVVFTCGNASGELHAPLLIFPDNSVNNNPVIDFPDAHFLRSSDGMINRNIFTLWLEHIFIPTVQNIKKPVILFVNENETSSKIDKLCEIHQIILYQLPKHPHYCVQPLDLSMFGELKCAYKDKVKEYQANMSISLDKENFALVLKKAWERGIKRDDLILTFEAAGIYPLHLD